MRTFTFNGIKSDTYFKTNKISRNLLPPISSNSIVVPARAGAYWGKQQLGIRRIEVRVTALGTSWEDLRAKLRTIANWLYTTSPQWLYFSDEPTKWYYARLSEETRLDELASMGETTLVFLCHDPYAYSSTTKSNTVGVNLLTDRQARAEDVNSANDFNIYSDSGTAVKGRSTAVKYAGTASVYVQSKATTAEVLSISTSAVRTTVSAGTAITAEVRTIVSGSAVGKSYRINAYCQDANNVTVAGGTFSGAFLTASTTGWQTHTVSFTAPTGTVKVFIEIVMLNALNGDTIYWDGACLNFQGQVTWQQNDGTAETFPVIRFVPLTATLSQFKITNQNSGKYVLINLPTGTYLNQNQSYKIDCGANTFTYEPTGENMIKYLDITSDFFSFGANGVTELSVLASTSFTTTVTYTERYL